MPAGAGSVVGTEEGVTTAPSFVQEVLDGVHHRIAAGGLQGSGGLAAGLAHVLRDAVVLLPALEGGVEVHRLPLRVAVLHQPGKIGRDGLRELPDDVAVLATKVKG